MLLNNIQNRLFSTGGAALLYRIALSAQHFALVPLFLKAWGVAAYGEWVLIYSVCMAFNLLNCGVGTAATNSYSIHLAKGNLFKAFQIYKSGLAVITIVVIIVMGLMLISDGIICGLIRDLNPAAQARDLCTASFLLCGSVLLIFYVQLNEGWFRGEGKVHTMINIRTAGLFGKVLLVFCFVSLDYGVVSVAACEFFVAFLVLAYQYTWCRRKIFNRKPVHVKICSKAMISLSVKGCGYMMFPLREALISQGGLLITRLFVGPEAVAILGTLRILSNSIVQLYAIINMSILPELQRYLAAGHHNIAKILYSASWGCTILLGVGSTISLMLLGPWLYGIWTSGGLQPSLASWVLIVFSLGLTSVWTTPSIMFIAVNKPKYLACVGLFAALLGVGVSFYLAQLYGVNGVLVGGACYNLLMAIFISRKAFLMMNLSLVEVMRNLKPASFRALAHSAPAKP